jgi:hypothetical protein
MANSDENVFGSALLTPKGTLFFYDFDSPNTAEKHPNNKYPSDKYDVTLGFKKTVDLSNFKKACDEVAEKAFGTTDGIDFPFTAGEDKGMDSMAGHIVIRAKSKKRAGCVDGDRSQITEAEIEAGMQARLQVVPMSYKSGKSKGVTLLLKNAQVYTSLPFDALGGGQSAESAFDDNELSDV